MVKNVMLVVLGILVVITAGVAVIKNNQISQISQKMAAVQVHNTELRAQLVIKEAAGRLLVEKIGSWEWYSPEAHALVESKKMPEGMTITAQEGGYLVKQGSTEMFFVPGEYSPRYRFSR